MPEFIYEVILPVGRMMMTGECLKKCAEFTNEHGLSISTAGSLDYRFDTVEGATAYLQDLGVSVYTHMLNSNFEQLYVMKELGEPYNV